MLIFGSRKCLRPMRFIRNSCTEPSYNMAFDEYCLESLAIDEPVFFLWQNRPAVIVGANQEVYSEVNLEYLEENNIALVRRVTGGGAVYHDLGNLNYTIVGSSEDLDRDYPEYTRQMQKALQALGVPATLSGRNDILVDGKKVSGFAKRVCRNRLMVHGTLMFNVDLDVLEKALRPSDEKLKSKGVASVRSRVTNLCEYLPEITDIATFKQRLEELLSGGYADKEWLLGEDDLKRIRQLATNKFANKEWTYGHSPKATRKHTERLACGTVEVSLTLAENRIAEIHIGGDFIGNLPPADVEMKLKGVSYERETIRHCLSQLNIDQYFDGVSVEDIIPLII